MALLGKEVRVAFVGRTSTEDRQDPRQSLTRQLKRGKGALPDSWVIVAHFFDVESGRLELDQRGKKSDYERFDIPIPRDGGIADLLSEAKRPDRRFDVVICESMSRIARKMYETLSVERELDQAEVPVFAANEPIMISGGRAQQILQRRINQSVAEYEVLNMLELSWGGLCTHVREGYNIGKPCHGYKAKKIKHPNPAKAERGLTKTRLEPDGVQAETVTLIANWRYHERLGADTIADRLNADKERYPPPVSPGRSRGAWSRSSVLEILRNPKYTGYQVYNRRARRSRSGKVNPREKWVWSNEPAHEPLISKWMFDEINSGSDKKRGSRDGSGPRKGSHTKRTYLFRRRIVCDCGRLMCGNANHGNTYYRCYPADNNRGRPDKHQGHPNTVYLREDVLAEAVNTFFAQRLFGADRRTLYENDLRKVDRTAEHARGQERDKVQRRLTELGRSQENLLNQAMAGESEDAFAKAARKRYNDLQEECDTKVALLAELDRQEAAEPDGPHPDAAQLLDALPHLALNLDRAPAEVLDRLFTLTNLTVQVHYETNEATLTVTLPSSGVFALQEMEEEMIKVAKEKGSTQAGEPGLCESSTCPRSDSN
ncbi:recombinase family protein [Pseudonocardiaceae bacterium YIM PH 21723]|nr:recombinase family protein [Pseudonocardiaceae bacterium YIM PH 21723]